MTRPTKLELFMRMAHLIKERSTCERATVGCLVVNADGTKIEAMGYNGNAKGLDNACDNPLEPGRCGCIHAETNALLKCVYNTHEALVLYCTTSPCVNCAKLIVNSRVSTVIFDLAHRDLAATQTIMAHGGVALMQYSPGHDVVAVMTPDGVAWTQRLLPEVMA